MPVQDLTPQLRTRLKRVERAVGWFVLLATLLLLAGFSYYAYATAKRKGWFLEKVRYYTYLRSGTGLNPGDTVFLMGFPAGRILEVTGTEPGKNWFTENGYDVFVKFEMDEPFYGYVWTDSQVRVGTGDLLGKRILEVTKGTVGEVTAIDKVRPIMVLKDPFPKLVFDYIPQIQQPKGYFVHASESPALSVRIDALADQVRDALPGILALTNQIAVVLDNSARLTQHLDETTLELQPILDNVAVISSRLTNGPGALGEWLIPPELNRDLQRTLATAASTLESAEGTLTNVDTNLVLLATSLNKTLQNLADITGNLSQQVKANDQMLKQISDAIVHTDGLVQGLKRHWLLRSAFKDEKPVAPPARNRSNTPGGGR